MGFEGHSASFKRRKKELAGVSVEGEPDYPHPDAKVLVTGRFREVHGLETDEGLDPWFMYTLFHTVRNKRLDKVSGERTRIVQVSWDFLSPETDEVCRMFMLVPDEQNSKLRRALVIEPNPNKKTYNIIDLRIDTSQRRDGATLKNVTDYSFEAFRFTFKDNGEFIDVQQAESPKNHIESWLLASDKKEIGSIELDYSHSAGITYFIDGVPNTEEMMEFADGEKVPGAYIDM